MGSTLVTMGPARDCANRDTSVYPGSGPSRLEVNPYFLPASYLLDSNDYSAPRAVWLDEEEEDRIPLC
jgi:hypothetical protein